MERFKGKIYRWPKGRRRLRYERGVSTTMMKQLEADIALLENNIGFFSKSKNAEDDPGSEQQNHEAKGDMASLIEKDRFDRQTE